MCVCVCVCEKREAGGTMFACGGAVSYSSVKQSHTHTHTHIYIYLYIYTYTYTYTHAFTHTHLAGGAIKHEALLPQGFFQMKSNLLVAAGQTISIRSVKM